MIVKKVRMKVISSDLVEFKLCDIFAKMIDVCLDFAKTSVFVLYLMLSGFPQYLLDKLQKVQNASEWLPNAEKSDYTHPILQTALAASNTLHSVQNFNCLFQFHPRHPHLYLSSLHQLKLQQDSYNPHPTPKPLTLCPSSCKHKNIL